MARDDAPSFSRPDRASVFGKRIKPVRSLVAENTKEALVKIWRSLEFRSESEFVAELIEIRVHGIDHVEKLHGQRARAVAGIGHESNMEKAAT